MAVSGWMVGCVGRQQAALFYSCGAGDRRNMYMSSMSNDGDATNKELGGMNECSSLQSAYI